MENLTPLIVMTYNIRHALGMDGRVDLGRIQHVIRESEADIVVLQEVDRFFLRSGLKDQLHVLSKGLSMHAAFAPCIKFGISQYGNGLLSKYPILEKRTFHLPSKGERRSLLHARLDVNGTILNVVNTHLGVSLFERQYQFPALTAFLDTLKESAVLAGDFNMDMSSYYMKRLASEWHKIELDIPGPTFVKGKEIDHIFVNDLALVKGVKAWIVQSDASDHYPVLAKVETNMVH